MAEPDKKELLYARDIYGRTLIELGKSDFRIVVLDADLSGSTRTAWFRKEFPERFFNVGVAEQNLMGVASGLASCGKIVFVSTFAMFATARAVDQIRNTICYNNLDVKIVATHGGITVGEDGSSHQALEDIAFLRPIPNMKIVVPCDAYETKDAVISAYKIAGPFYIRLGRAKVPTIEGKKEFVFGKGYIIREGDDIGVITCGVMIFEALKAARLLQDRGISVCVVNMHTIKPIDRDLIITLAQRYNRLVVCEEHQSIGGLYSAVSEVLSEEYSIPVKSIGIRDCFGQSGSPQELMEAYGLSSQHIAKTVEDFICGKKD